MPERFCRTAAPYSSAVPAAIVGFGGAAAGIQCWLHNGVVFSTGWAPANGGPGAHWPFFFSKFDPSEGALQTQR